MIESQYVEVDHAGQFMALVVLFFTCDNIWNHGQRDKQVSSECIYLEALNLT